MGAERVKDLLPGRAGHVGVTAEDNRLLVEAALYRSRAGIPRRDLPERFGDWKEEGAHPVRPRGQGRRAGGDLPALGGCRRQRARDDRRHDRPRPSAQRRSRRGDRAAEAIGRSKGGLSTKIHATVEAPGDPTSFALARARAGARPRGGGRPAPRAAVAAGAPIADKAFDAEERVLGPLTRAGKAAAVIPPKANRKNPRPYDRDLHQARHLIENFFAKLKQHRAIATRYDTRARNFLAAIRLAAAVTWLN